MRQLAKLHELKEKIISKLASAISCNITFIKFPTEYQLSNNFSNDFVEGSSSITFYKKRLIEAVVIITLKDLSYYAEIKIPSKKRAKKLILDAKIAETCQDYIAILEELLVYDPVFEFVSETIYRFHDPIAYHKLDRAIYGNGDVTLSYTRREGDLEVKYRIKAVNKHNRLILTYRKARDKLEVKTIKLETVPEVFYSIVDYMLEVYGQRKFNKLKTAIRYLIDLVKVEKYNIEDAIRELVEKYGYRDIFG